LHCFAWSSCNGQEASVNTVWCDKAAHRRPCHEVVGAQSRQAHASSLTHHGCDEVKGCPPVRQAQAQKRVSLADRVLNAQHIVPAARTGTHSRHSGATREHCANPPHASTALSECRTSRPLA
jgi:hypothetical protein